MFEYFWNFFVLMHILYMGYVSKYRYSELFDFFKDSQSAISPWKIAFTIEFPTLSKLIPEPISVDICHFIILLIKSNKPNVKNILFGPVLKEKIDINLWKNVVTWNDEKNPLYVFGITSRSNIVKDWISDKDNISIPTIFEGGVYKWALNYEPSSNSISVINLWNFLFSESIPIPISKKALIAKTAESAMTGFFSGGTLGATLGSVVPGFGTVIGAALGGVIGGAIGGMASWYYNKKIPEVISNIEIKSTSQPQSRETTPTKFLHKKIPEPETFAENIIKRAVKEFSPKLKSSPSPDNKKSSILLNLKIKKAPVFTD